MQPPARIVAAAALAALAVAGVSGQSAPLKSATPTAQNPPAQNPPAAQTPKPAAPSTPPATATPGTPATPGAPAAPRPAAPRPQPKPTPTQVIVRDVSGMALGGVKIATTGPVSIEVTTEPNGTASLGVLPDGTYRLRFERDGFMTFEREVTTKAGQPSEVYVALRIAPVAIAPAPPPAPAPAPPPPPVATLPPGGPPVFVSIPEFLDKNYIRREPLKESVLGCLSTATTRLLQLHDGVADHAHADVDETLYIVAGEGAIRVKGESTAVAAGSLTIIPHGLQHGIERRGKNPLMVLSTLSGAPCRVVEQPQSVSSSKK